MQRNDLQDALAYLHTLFVTYEAQGVQITGSRMPMTQYANFAAMKYLLFLANQDRIITRIPVHRKRSCLQTSSVLIELLQFRA